MIEFINDHMMDVLEVLLMIHYTYPIIRFIFRTCRHPVIHIVVCDLRKDPSILCIMNGKMMKTFMG